MTDAEKALKLLQLLESTGPSTDWASVPGFTPEQTQLVTALIKQQVLEAMDEGMSLAVEMIRLSPPHLTKDEIANLIVRSIHDPQ
jgi:hypothetical protein